MRSETELSSTSVARACLSCTTHVVYSVCRMRLPATGRTLPWQLDGGARSRAGVVPAAGDACPPKRVARRWGHGFCREEDLCPDAITKIARHAAASDGHEADIVYSRGRGVDDRLNASLPDLRRAARDPARHRYLPAERLRALAERLEIPLFHLQAVASFYPHFF